MVPLVQRPRLVDAFVALQPYEIGTARISDGTGQLGLADSRGTFDQQRLAQLAGQEHRGRNGIGREVVGSGELGLDVVDRGERHGAHAYHRAVAQIEIVREVLLTASRGVATPH